MAFTWPGRLRARVPDAEGFSGRLSQLDSLALLARAPASWATAWRAAALRHHFAASLAATSGSALHGSVVLEAGYGRWLTVRLVIGDPARPGTLAIVDGSHARRTACAMRSGGAPGARNCRLLALTEPGSSARSVRSETRTSSGCADSARRAAMFTSTPR